MEEMSIEIGVSLRAEGLLADVGTEFSAPIDDSAATHLELVLDWSARQDDAVLGRQGLEVLESLRVGILHQVTLQRPRGDKQQFQKRFIRTEALKYESSCVSGIFTR